MKYRVTAYQVFCLLNLTAMGSSALFYLGGDAKQDAWLVLLSMMFVGIFLQLIYTTLFFEYPNDTIISYMPKIFGKVLGYILGISYTFYFAHIAARVLRDFIELILIVVLPGTAPYLIALVLMSTITYGAFLGIESMGRLAQIMLPFYVGVIVFMYISLFATPGLIDIKSIQPVLEKGFTRILKTAYPLLITFPYGETVVLAMVYPSLNMPKKARKTGVLSIIFLGVFLSFNMIVIISTLGVDFASASLFPLLEIGRLINIGFIDRIDIFVILVMIIGGFFKITVFTYGTVIGTAQLLGIKKDPRWLAVPVGIALYIYSFFVARNYPEHIEIGLKIIPPLTIQLQVTIPIIAITFHFVRKWVKSRKRSKQTA